eukprot:gnl/MRDRNA2_/MRDRNA2_83527_c0_seq1.p1 gnl/MRDRNA2_/MRDRNA2_83527_c0~~gnl/MRDRNA2_/MRDRNA2_83527_c0_seq1.p1  ORF type:complete len:333 (+),score=14.15 gnl/MRDRNA2_/MRDRNA2_83527_c0_seq1:653-1651(+)
MCHHTYEHTISDAKEIQSFTSRTNDHHVCNIFDSSVKHIDETTEASYHEKVRKSGLNKRRSLKIRSKQPDKYFFKPKNYTDDKKKVLSSSTDSPPLFRTDLAKIFEENTQRLKPSGKKNGIRKSEMHTEIQTTVDSQCNYSNTDSGHLDNKLKEPLDYQDIRQHRDDIILDGSMGRGIGTTLEIMRNQGMLHSEKVKQIEKNENLQKLSSNQAISKNTLLADTVQNDTDAISERVDIALRRTDKYGKPLAAKEAFRELCYRFHGKGPSKNRLRKRVNQHLQMITRAKKATSELVTWETNRSLEIQRKLSSPYILLDRNFNIESKHTLYSKPE